ncbi:MAG: hypothetical protein Q9175_000170 [Cornicularia normoerica]
MPLITRGSFATNTTSVQDGDTFFTIAHSAGIPIESLEAANPGVVANDLYVGQVINLPSNNEPATGTLASNTASSLATAAALTTLATSARSPVRSSSFSSASSSVVTSVSVSRSSTAASSPTSTGSKLPPSSTTPSPPSTTPSPTSTIPPSPTVSSTPNSPPAAAVCRPSPTGPHHDAADVESKTDGFCNQYDATLQTTLYANAGSDLNGDSQGNAAHAGNEPNEEGYNMTITAIPNCSVEGATVQYPLSSANPDFNCTTILFDAWKTCYNNDADEHDWTGALANGDRAIGRRFEDIKWLARPADAASFPNPEISTLFNYLQSQAGLVSFIFLFPPVIINASSMTSVPYKLLGAECSMFTRKVRLYMSIQFKEVTASDEAYKTIIVPQTGVAFMRTLIIVHQSADGSSRWETA